MAGEALQHVIQKADAGIDVGLARPVKVQGDGDLGLAGLALDGGGAHAISFRGFRPLPIVREAHTRGRWP